MKFQDLLFWRKQPPPTPVRKSFREYEQEYMRESILSPLATEEYERRIRGSFGSYQSEALLNSLFIRASTRKREIIAELEDIKNFYLVQTILSLYAEDAFAPSIHDGNILSVRSEDKKLQRAIDALDERIGFDTFITDIAYDFMLYGDFCLETEVEKDKGIIAIHDNVWQQGIIPVTKFGQSIGYLVLNETGKMEFRDPADYVRFSLGPYGTRIDLYEELDGILPPNIESFKDLPRYVKIGRSLIHPILDKLRELQLLEALVPATKLAKLTSGSLVGVQVPVTMEPKAAFDSCRKIEDLINKRVAIDTSSKSLSIDSVISSAGKIKIVPIFGDKGTLNKMDYKMDEPDDLLASVEDIRRTIMSSVGYPYELIFGGESGDKKSELLKKYARYLMRLRNVQSAACEGLKDLIIIDLINKGFNSFKRADIQVSFKQKLLEINNTETLEFMDISVSYLDNLHKFINELMNNENIKFDVDLTVLKNFLNENLTLTGLENVITEVELTPIEERK